MSIDDGVIKFNHSDFTVSKSIDIAEYDLLESARKVLFKLELIGEYKSEKVGYGNISQRIDYSKLSNSHKPQFLITGTQTGKHPELDGSHYTRIIDYSIEQNSVSVHGPIKASSESLTHASIYEANSNITFIFHVHHNQLWKKVISEEQNYTAKDIPYGTLEMAKASQKIIKDKTTGYFAMGGHEDGLIFYGNDCQKLIELTKSVYYKYT